MVCYWHQRTCQWMLWLNYRAPYLHRQTLSKFPLVNSITHCCGNISLHDHEERSHTGISYSVFNAFYLSYNTLDHLTTASIEIFLSWERDISLSYDLYIVIVNLYHKNHFWNIGSAIIVCCRCCMVVFQWVVTIRVDDEKQYDKWKRISSFLSRATAYHRNV